MSGNEWPPVGVRRRPGRASIFIKLPAGDVCMHVCMYVWAAWARLDIHQAAHSMQVLLYEGYARLSRVHVAQSPASMYACMCACEYVCMHVYMHTL